MKNIKNLKRLIIILVMLILIPGISVSAANKYYMVEGRIYFDGFAEINRIGIVEHEGMVKSGVGQDYAVSAVNVFDGALYTTAIDVNFKSSSDVNAPPAEYAEFSALIPYDEEIAGFYLFDSDYNMLDWGSPHNSVQIEIDYFNVKQTDYGFLMDWDVTLEDDSYAQYLNFGVVAVSQKTGERNVLAYRTAEKSLNVPNDWLDPNDDIIFILESNDKYSTLFYASDVFSTPDGEAKTITEDWSEIGADYLNEWEDVWIDWDYVLELLPFILIPVAGIIILVIIIIMRKRKKKSKNDKSEKPKKEKIVKAKPEKKEKPVKTKETAEIAENPITLKINGAAVDTKSSPVMQNGRVFVPVRVIAEALEYIAAWDSETKIIDIYDPQTKELKMKMQADSEKVKVSTAIQGVTDERVLDAPAKLINGVIYAPAKFMAETTGCIFDWNEAEKIVNITKL